MKRVRLALGFAAAILVTVPSGASAATQVGQTVDPSSSFCSPNGLTWLQSESPANGSFVVPSDGVITSWSYLATTFPPAQLKLKLGHVGAGTLTIVAESGPGTPVAGQLNTFPSQVTAHAGEIIGFNQSTSGRCAAAGQVGYTAAFAFTDIPPGAPPAPTTTEPGTHLDLSALLETDCDKDGFGDETQDTNLSSCAPGTTPKGTSSVTCKGRSATIVGTAGNDVRVASRGPDVIAGLGGNDTLSGLGGDDVICGGPGKDKLKGGSGKDTLLGQAGADTLKGGGAKDVCKGGKGNDSGTCEVEKSI
jgi:hypothetical protein